MIHARSDYDRIQDPAVNDPSLLSEGSTPIGEDEPVFLIRAKDKYAVMCLQAWALQAFIDGQSHLGVHVMGWALAIERWQKDNGRKKPDAPSETLKPLAPIL